MTFREINGDIFSPICYWTENLLLFPVHTIFYNYGESTENHYQKYCRGQHSLQLLFQTTTCVTLLIYSRRINMENTFIYRMGIVIFTLAPEFFSHHRTFTFWIWMRTAVFRLPSEWLTVFIQHQIQNQQEYFIVSVVKSRFNTISLLIRSYNHIHRVRARVKKALWAKRDPFETKILDFHLLHFGPSNKFDIRSTIIFKIDELS